MHKLLIALLRYASTVCIDLSFLRLLKGSPGFGIPGQPGPKGETGERVSVINKK